MIKEIILWQNDMIMVFDDEGNQMPELQGHKDKVYDKLKKANTSKATFAVGIWGIRIIPIMKTAFFELCKKI